jgi:hypothetical protein
MENKVRMNERVYLRVNDITGNTINNIEYVELDNGFAYYSKRLFRQKFGMSERTMQRRQAEIINKYDYWRYCIPFEGYKTIYSIALLGVNKKNLNGRNRAEYIQFLSMFNWDIIGTIRPCNAKTINSVRGIMDGLNKALKKRYKDHTITIWYNVEQNPDLSGYHAHFVIKTSYNNHEAIQKWLKHYLGKFETSKTENTIDSSVHIDRFHVNDEWLAYITKQIDTIPDGYDLLTNIKI